MKQTVINVGKKSTDLLFQPFEFRRGEKFAQGDIQPVAQLFDGHNGHVPPLWVQHAVYRGRRDARTGSQFIRFDAALPAERLKALRHNVLDSHDDHLKGIVKSCSQTRVRTCVILKNVLSYVYEWSKANSKKLRRKNT